MPKRALRFPEATNGRVPLSHCHFTVKVPPAGAINFIWDLESTGLDTKTDDITQIGCVCGLIVDGKWSALRSTVDNRPLEFSVYVSTDRHIPDEVVRLTGVAREYLDVHGVPLETALLRWAEWCQVVKSTHMTKGRVLWFVAHNGNSFDLPLLLAQEERHCGWQPGAFLRQVGVSAIVDTVVLSRRLRWPPQSGRKSHKLQDLYSGVFGIPIFCQHDALGDCRALADLMMVEPFLSAWRNKPIAWTLHEFSKSHSHNMVQQNRHQQILSAGCGAAGNSSRCTPAASSSNTNSTGISSRAGGVLLYGSGTTVGLCNYSNNYRTTTSTDTSSSSTHHPSLQMLTGSAAAPNNSVRYGRSSSDGGNSSAKVCDAGLQKPLCSEGYVTGKSHIIRSRGGKKVNSTSSSKTCTPSWNADGTADEEVTVTVKCSARVLCSFLLVLWLLVLLCRNLLYT
eukprot:Lankesteria_metandrocarpae@DN4126_c0_g1_i2.p1